MARLSGPYGVAGLASEVFICAYNFGKSMVDQNSVHSKKNKSGYLVAIELLISEDSSAFNSLVNSLS